MAHKILFDAKADDSCFTQTIITVGRVTGVGVQTYIGSFETNEKHS